MCHNNTPCVDLWLDTRLSQATPLCSRCYERQEGTRNEPHPRAEEQVCFPCKHRLINQSTSLVTARPGAAQVLHTFAHHRQEQCCAVLRPCHKEETWAQGLKQQEWHGSKSIWGQGGKRLLRAFDGQCLCRSGRGVIVQHLLACLTLCAPLL